MPSPDFRPRQSGSATGRLWAIADALADASGDMPTGRQVVDAYMAEDPARNPNTGFTQYSAWKKARMAAGAAVLPDRVVVQPDGSLTLPPAAARTLGVKPGTPLFLTFEDGALRLTASDAAVDRMRRLVAPLRQEGVVDGFLADRRGQWGGE